MSEDVRITLGISCANILWTNLKSYLSSELMKLNYKDLGLIDGKENKNYPLLLQCFLLRIIATFITTKELSYSCKMGSSTYNSFFIRHIHTYFPISWIFSNGLYLS